jgi:hypothetical protein
VSVIGKVIDAVSIESGIPTQGTSVQRTQLRQAPRMSQG